MLLVFQAQNSLTVANNDGLGAFRHVNQAVQSTYRRLVGRRQTTSFITSELASQTSAAVA